MLWKRIHKTKLQSTMTKDDTEKEDNGKETTAKGAMRFGEGILTRTENALGATHGGYHEISVLLSANGKMDKHSQDSRRRDAESLEFHPPQADVSDLHCLCKKILTQCDKFSQVLIRSVSRPVKKYLRNFMAFSRASWSGTFARFANNLGTTLRRIISRCAWSTPPPREACFRRVRSLQSGGGVQ